MALTSAAGGGGFRADRRRVMRDILNVTVGELMSKPVVTVTPATSIAALRKTMAEHDFNSFPVVNDVGALQGLVTRLDLFRLYLLPYAKFIPAVEDTWVSSVGAIMSRGVIALYAAEPAIKAMALMVERGIRTIPIVEDTTAGTVVIGVVTRRDLSAALAD
jgi:CBS domain-containing membrane protein